MNARVLYLARHGETDWNIAGRWQGQTDVPLNANGYVQAARVGQMLAGTGVASAASSDLSRAMETARVAGQRIGVSLEYVDAGLRERAFGLFEGLTREECARTHPEEWRAWLDEHRPPAGGEDRDALAERVTAALGRAVERATGDAPVLVVTHGGSMRAAILRATGQMPPPIANGAVWRVVWHGGGITAAEPYSAPVEALPPAGHSG